MSATATKKYLIEVRRYVPGHTQYGNESMGKITGDFGRYEVVDEIKRALRSEQIGNFCPLFCTYKGDKRVLVHSSEGDVSDPFRADESYLQKLFIVAPPSFNLGDRVVLADPNGVKKFPAMVQGVVVKYFGDHNPSHPRVRWASGWGVSSKAKDLRLMTDLECKQYPYPTLVANDL